MLNGRGELGGKVEDVRRRSDELSREIVGAAIEVHRILGPGLLESAYEEAPTLDFLGSGSVSSSTSIPSP